jgi:hypothetical protein
VSSQFEFPHRPPVIAVLAVAAIALLSLAPGGPGAPVVRGAASVNLDQWATLDAAWQNGNLNGNNTRYPEGGIVPFRLAIEGLNAGAHTIRIQYDFTAGGHKAYDFLALYNGWVAPPICSASGGGISSMCPSMPAPSSAAFPSDGFKTDGLTVAGAQDYSGVSRRMTIWGGAITSISGPVHAGSTGGNSTAEFVVHFTSKASAVELAWGGHLAQSAYWDMAAGGQRDGAGQVSGSPWHMRTLQLDGSGNRNQDRSIQPSAIVGELPPRALAPATPTPRPTAKPAPTPVLRRTVQPPATPQPTGGVPVVAGAPQLPNPTGPPSSVATPPGIAEADDTPVHIFFLILIILDGVAVAVTLRRIGGRAQPR